MPSPKRSLPAGRAPWPPALHSACDFAAGVALGLENTAYHLDRWARNLRAAAPDAPPVVTLPDGERLTCEEWMAAELEEIAASLIRPAAALLSDRNPATVRERVAAFAAEEGGAAREIGGLLRARSEEAK